MKEYRIRMNKGDGKWGMPWSATGIPAHIIISSKKHAERRCKELEREWKKNRPGEYAEFRVEEREISDWKTM